MKLLLGDIVEKIQTGPFGSQLHREDYTLIGTPVIMPQDIVNWRLSTEKIVYVDDDTVERLNRHKVSINDIIYPRRGDISKCAIIGRREQDWLCGTGCLKITIDSEKANPKYVFYYLQQEKIGKWIERHATGATMLNINSKTLETLPLDLPELPIQNKVLEILSAYDDLIENCKQQIALLEEAARRLYREWFVDMRFPGHETTPIGENGLPEGWKFEKVGNLLRKIKRSPLIQTINYQPTGVLPIIDQSRKFIAGYTDNLDAKVNEELPIILFGDHTRILKFITFDFARGADGTQLIISNNERMPQCLFYLSLKHVDLSNYSYARHYKYLKEERVIMPTEAIAQKFECLISKYFSEISVLQDMLNKSLNVRDILLPRLISGQIEINA